MSSVQSKCNQVSADYEAARRELEALRTALEQKEHVNCNLSVECENQLQKIREMEMKASCSLPALELELMLEIRTSSLSEKTPGE